MGLTTDTIAKAEAGLADLENPGAPQPVKTVRAPQDITAGTAPRKMRDVSTPEVIGAGGTAEAIETDYWFLTEREYDDRLNALMKIAEGVGEVPRGTGGMYIPPTDQSPADLLASDDPGPRPGLLLEDERQATIRRARAKNPEAFKGMAVSRAEIEAEVNRSLRAEWDDAQATLAAAPDAFLSRTVPEFIGRAGTAMTDEFNLPLAVASMGVGSAASIGRVMLTEGVLSVAGEAATIPKQFDMADRLGTPEPNPALQLAFAGVVGAALPAGLHLGGTVISATASATNRQLVKSLRKGAPKLSDEQRAGLDAVERQVAEEDLGPSPRGAENWETTDKALEDIDAGRAPSPDVPRADAARVEAMITPPRHVDPAAPGSTVQMDFELGPNRPQPPSQPVLDVISASVEDVLGPGARVVVTSGQEGNLPQFGSNRHMTGDAADIAIYDAAGDRITMETHPELMRELARAAARRGAKGIGLGAEYMDGAHIHVDLVDPGAGQATAWGSEGAAMLGELDRIRGTGASPRAIEANIGDLIRDSEAGGSFDRPSDFSVIAPPKPLTQMTLDEVDAWQTANRAAGAESTSAGGFQILRDTLRGLRDRMGLKGDELFDPDMQTRLAGELMKDAGLEDFKAGRIDAATFGDQLAAIWAALPKADGAGVYDGDGLNRANVGRDAFLNVLTGTPYYSSGRPTPRMTRVMGTTTRVDPKTYQFRTEVDEGGVGTPMDRVNQWDELLAGDFIMHRRNDGFTYIADGHHRRQLAERLEAEGHAPIEFNSFVLREDEGYTVEHVRAIAAVKNIEAGNATAIDAAKVLRIDPAMLERLTLRNSQARDARGLMQLSDDSFDMVTNGLVREDQAAFIPSLTRDPAMQDALMRVLIRMRPRSMAEARQIANDAYRAGMAKSDSGNQSSLFGDDFLPEETLFKERAELMAKAMAQLRSDKRVFATLVRERDRIQEAGNALTDKTNTARLSSDELALNLVERLVNRAGPLDDALNDAARAVRGGASLRSSVSDFLEFVRGAIEGGNLSGLLDGSKRGPIDVAAPDGRAPEISAELNPDIVAAAIDVADMFGVPAPTARALLEAEINAPLRGGDSATGEGLFDLGARDQTDMFSDAGRVSDGAAADMFGEPSAAGPDVTGQMSAAENALRDALARGEDFELPTGRIIDGKTETMSAADVLAELDADTNFMEILNVCKS